MKKIGISMDIMRYGEFAAVDERAVVIKSGQNYFVDEVKGPYGMVKVYFNKNGVLGANDRHIAWEELLKLHEKTR